MRSLVIGLGFAVLIALVPHAQEMSKALSTSSGQADVIFVVRHAERADGGASPKSMTASPDPALSPAGHARAKALASLLRAAGIKRIYVTEFTRARQTAEPIAASADVEIATVPSKDTDGLVRTIAVGGSGAGAALVVGHSNTVPAILEALGVREPIAIADDEYDNLFVVVRGPSTPATLIALKY